MTDSDQPQKFCTQCGAQVSSGSAFCSSWGKNLTSPPVNRNTPRPILEEEDLRRIAISVGIVVLLLLLFGLFSYSLALGTFVIAAGVAALLAWRRTRGLQSRPEQQLYEFTQKHWASTREAYREGKHRETAAKAQGFGRNLYEGSRARYEAWNESRTNSAVWAGRFVVLLLGAR